MQSGSYDSLAKPHQTFHWPRTPSALTFRPLQLGLIVLMSFVFGLTVIVFADKGDHGVKLLIGLIGGLTFVLITMRWPEIGILGFVALLSGLIPLGYLPLLHMGPVSMNVSDAMLMVILGLVFLRATTQPGFKLIGSPLMLPLLLFIGAFFVSAVNGILGYGVSMNYVFRTIRVLILWTVFIPTLQLVRGEQALRRLLIGLLVFTGVLLFGVLISNRLAPLLYIDVVAPRAGALANLGFTRFYYNGDMILYAMIPVTVASLGMIKKGNQLWRIGLLGLLFYWVFRTYFRQYWLTLFVICALLLVFLSGRERLRLLRRMAPVVAAVVLLVIVLMAIQPAQVERVAFLVTDRLGSLLRDPINRETSLQWRVIETRYAMVQINRHPILGIGLANSYRPPMEYESGTTMYNDWTSRYIENGYLYIALMMGLVGMLPFLWLCVTYLFRVFRYQHEIRDDSLRAIYLGFGLAFLGMMACNIATPTFVIGTRLVFFPLAMAICEVILRLEREKSACQ